MQFTSAALDLRGLSQTTVDETRYPPTDVDVLIDTIGPETGERWYARVLDSLGLRIETLSPTRFVQGAKEFLKSMGLDGSTDIFVDGKLFHEESKDPTLTNATEPSSKRSRNSNRLPHEIEVNSHGTREPFLLWMSLFYLRKHRRDQSAVEVEVSMLQRKSGPIRGESLAGHKDWLDEQVSLKKALLSDLEVRVSNSFPGVRLLLLERVS
jgi:hypothetical protein